MRLAFVLVVTAVAAAVAFSGAAAAGDDAPFDRTCATNAGRMTPPGPPYSSQDVRFGRLFFLRLDRHHRWRLRRGMHGTLKIPVVVDGEPVTVRITPLGRTRARLDFDVAQWGREAEGRRVADGDGQRAVRFHACPASTVRFKDGTPSSWTGYPGGFLVDRPGCARLTATAKGMRTVRRRIALGVAPSRCRA